MLNDTRNDDVVPRGSEEDDDGDGLGLSLRVASSCSEAEGGGDAAEEMMRGFRAKQAQNNNMSGMMNHVNSPPNKRARVSVRARCDSATVSSINFLINSILFLVVSIYIYNATIYFGVGGYINLLLNLDEMNR